MNSLSPAILCLALAAAGPLAAGEIRGSVALVTKAGKPVAADELSEAVVWFEPSAPVPVQPAESAAVMTTRGKKFVPRVVAVTKGSAVSFPNEDLILHNAFSVSPGNAFDAGLYGPGEGHVHVFEQPGIVRVFCNVHQSMAGYVVVVATPFFTRPLADGSFALPGVPDGPGRLRAWHPLAEEIALEIPRPGADPVHARLTVTQKRVPPHDNKLGRPYDAMPAPAAYQ